MDDRTGDWLAERYRLDTRIGEEAGGAVYEAWDGAYLLRVVVRILPPALVPTPETLTAYRQQAGRVRRVARPGLLPLHDLAQDGETVYLVLDAFPGPTLAESLRAEGGPYPPLAAARLLRPVAEALDALHAAGVVHRAINLDTVMVTPEGTGVLREPAFAPPGTDAALAAHPAFLSPEQARGDVPDARADVYAFGALLYTLVTGVPPFDGAAAPSGTPAGDAIAWEQIHRAPPAPRTGHPRWDGAILSALSADPAARPPAATNLLGALLDEEGERTVPIFGLGASDDDAVGSRTAAWTPGETTTALASPPQTGPALGAAAAGRVPDAWGAEPPRRRSAWGVALAILTVLVLGSAVALGAFTLRRNATVAAQRDRYAQAEFALARGDYDTAAAAFDAAGPYRDAPARAAAARTEKEQKAAYDAGVAAFGREEYAAAADAFGTAGPFMDAPQRRADAQRRAEQQAAYAEGQAALAKEEYAAAANAFARAGPYRDAPQQASQAQTLIVQQRQYQQAKDAFAQEDYTAAAVAFRAAGAYKDAPDRAALAERFRTQKAAYDAGVTAAAKEDYKTATQQFLAAGDYKDAQTRAQQANQEDALLAKYTSARENLRASKWKEAYADLQAIKQIRPDYRDTPDIISHLENDVMNPTTVELSAALNATNGYKEAWVPVNNLIGQPVVWLYIVPTLSARNDGKPDLIGAVSLFLVPKQGGTGANALNGETPTLATSNDPRDAAIARPNEKSLVVTEKEQTLDVQEFGKYRARLTIRDVALQPRAPIKENQTTAYPVFTRLIVDITLTPKS